MSDPGNRTRGTRQRETLNRATEKRGNANHGFGSHISPTTARRVRALQKRFQRELGEAIESVDIAEKILSPTTKAPEKPRLKPEPVPDEVLQLAMETPYTSKAYIGTEAFYIERGDVVLDQNDRKRLVVAVDQHGDIFYIDTTGAWFQRKQGFVNDVWWGKVSKDVARGTAAIYKLIYLEWQFIKGIISTASWAYWVGIRVFDVMEFITENRSKIEGWIKAFKIWNRVSGLLYIHSPTLWAVFDRYLTGTIWPHTTEAIDDPIIAKRVGIFTGNVLKNAIKKGKFTPGAPLWELIKGYFLARIVAMPKALKTVLENAKNPFVLIEHLKELGMQITPEVAIQIKIEYENNPVTLQEALTLTNDVIELLKND